MRYTAVARSTVERNVLVAVVYFALGAATLSVTATVTPHIAPIWPAGGFALAVLLLFGRACWPGILLGAVAVPLVAGATAPVALGVGAGRVIEALFAAHLLRAQRGFRPDLQQVNDVVAFVLITLLASHVGALLGNVTLVLAEVAPGQVVRGLMYWWIGDWAGALIVCPLILAYTRADVRYTAAQKLELTSLLAACACVAAALFFGFDLAPLDALAHSPFLLFLFVLWAALRFGVRGTSAVTAVVYVIALLGTVQGSGVFHARLHSESTLLVPSLFCMVLAITGLLAASVNAHRSREHALARDRALLHQILDGLPVGVWTADRNGAVQTSNPAAVRMWGGSHPPAFSDAGSFKATRISDGRQVGPDDCPMARAIHAQEKTDGEPYEVETFDGRRKTVIVSAWPLRAGDEMVGAVAVHQDITELREADKSIRQLYAVVEQTDDIVFLTGRDGLIEYVNPSFVRHTGYTREEVVGRGPAMLKSGMHEPSFYRQLWQSILAGRPYSAVIANRKKNGDIYYESKTISHLRNDQGEITHFVSTGRDVTEAIEAEKALRTRALHQQVVAQIGQRALAGTGLAELMHEAVKSVCAALDIRHCKIMMASPDRTALVIKAGSGFCGPSAERIALPANCPAAIAFASGKATIVGDYRARPDIEEPPYVLPGTLRSGLDVIIPGADGPVGVFAVHAETPGYFSGDDQNFVQAVANALGAVVQREQADQRLRQMNADLELRVQARTSELAQANRGLEIANRELEGANAELNAFAYSVSHDLRGPLRRIQGFSDLVLKEERERLGHGSAKRLERIAANAADMGSLVDDLLHLSRISRHKLVRERFSVSAMAQSAIGALRDQQPGRAVRVEVQEGMQACGDKSLVRLALGNLLENAWKFTGTVADAHIAVGSLEQGGEARYYVKDNGAGFDMRYADRLFKPFERLHHQRDFQGTGIGLSIVHRVVAKHGGRVWAESRPGQGACFWFTLPEVPSAGPPAGGCECGAVWAARR